MTVKKILTEPNKLLRQVSKPVDFVGKEELSHIRLTLDFIEDYNLIKKIYEKFYKENPKFSMNDILEFLDSNPELLRINEKHIQFKKKS